MTIFGAEKIDSLALKNELVIMSKAQEQYLQTYIQQDSSSRRERAVVWLRQLSQKPKQEIKDGALQEWVYQGNKRPVGGAVFNKICLAELREQNTPRLVLHC